MSILNSIRAQVPPIHPEGYPFIGAFALVSLIFFLIWPPLGWIGTILTVWCALFFRDHSSEVIDDDVFQRLMTFPDVLVTAHQGFFTVEALREIAAVTLANLACFARGVPCANALVPAGGV